MADGTVGRIGETMKLHRASDPPGPSSVKSSPFVRAAHRLKKIRNRKLEFSSYLRQSNVSAVVGLVNFKNRMFYGPKAPRYGERIWVNPSRVRGIRRSAVEVLGWGRPGSSAIIYESWPISDQDTLDLSEMDKIKMCISHWRDGVPWEETGIFEYYLSLGWDASSISARHRALDNLFADVSQERRLKSREELEGTPTGEIDGITISIGPAGELLFADIGTHRLAIALVLELPVVPAQIGCIHKDAICMLQAWRNPSEA